MRQLILLAILMLSGCASQPYVEARFSYQLDRMSDWVLQPEREWICTDGTCDQEVRLQLQLGTEWENRVSCFVEGYVGAQYQQTFLGCSKMFGAKDVKGWFLEPSLRHQVDSATEPFLRTDQKQWQGHNPFVHLRVGYRLSGFRCGIATGKSLFQGAPFEKEEGEPDLYWTNVECGYRFGGYTGMWK